MQVKRLKASNISQGVGEAPWRIYLLEIQNDNGRIEHSTHMEVRLPDRAPYLIWGHYFCESDSSLANATEDFEERIKKEHVTEDLSFEPDTKFISM